MQLEIGKLLKKKRLYPKENLVEAVRLVEEENCTFGEASRVTGVPTSTIHDKLSNKYNKDKPGPSPLLQYELEQLLAEHLTEMAMYGYGSVSV